MLSDCYSCSEQPHSMVAWKPCNHTDKKFKSCLTVSLPLTWTVTAEVGVNVGFSVLGSYKNSLTQTSQFQHQRGKRGSGVSDTVRPSGELFHWSMTLLISLSFSLIVTHLSPLILHISVSPPSIPVPSSSPACFDALAHFFYLFSPASFPRAPSVWTLSISTADLIKTKVRGFHSLRCQTKSHCSPI